MESSRPCPIKSITRNRFRQPMYSSLAGRYNPIPTWFLTPIDSEIPAQDRLFIPCSLLPIGSSYIARVLEMCWPIRVSSFPHTQHMTTTILNTSVPSHGIGDSKNIFYNGKDFSQGSDSMESMHRILKNVTNWGIVQCSPLQISQDGPFIVTKRKT